MRDDQSDKSADATKRTAQRAVSLSPDAYLAIPKEGDSVQD